MLNYHEKSLRNSISSTNISNAGETENSFFFAKLQNTEKLIIIRVFKKQSKVFTAVLSEFQKF